MKNIRILHLYSDALDLYGDYKNLTVLCQRIAETGNTSEITEVNLGEAIDPSGFDFVYIGHGKARNLAAVAPHFVQYSASIRAAIEGGQLWLVTGNARELFGQSFTTPAGEVLPGIGLFNYTGVETNKVFVSDVLAQPVYDVSARVYGFVNRTAYLEGENSNPLFTVLSGCGDGETPDGKEGTLYRNFFATWSMGPILARNPSLMRELLHRLLGDDYRECDFSLEEKALNLVIAEFDKNKEGSQ